MRAREDGCQKGFYKTAAETRAVQRPRTPHSTPVPPLAAAPHALRLAPPANLSRPGNDPGELLYATPAPLNTAPLNKSSRSLNDTPTAMAAGTQVMVVATSSTLRTDGLIDSTLEIT